MGEGSTLLRIIRIIPDTAVDGPGLRTALYFAGCHHHCPGCHNPGSWDPAVGRDWTIEEVLSEIRVSGHHRVTVTGGDALCFQAPGLRELLRALEAEGLAKDIWLYTGYTYEEVVAKFPWVLGTVSVIVDGRFRADLRDTELLYRGSSNQRLVDVRESVRTGTLTLWDPASSLSM